jgi:hypothetical protein
VVEAAAGAPKLFAASIPTGKTGPQVRYVPNHRQPLQLFLVQSRAPLPPASDMAHTASDCVITPLLVAVPRGFVLEVGMRSEADL